MITKTLFKQNIQKNIRKQGFYKNMWVNIILILFALYMLGCFLVLGFTLGPLLATIPVAMNPVQIMNGAFLYLLLGGIIMRYVIQPLNTVDLHVYQTLPIPRKSLVNYLIYKPLINPINYFLLLFLIPFAIKTVVPIYGGLAAFGFIVTGITISIFNLQLASYLKRLFAGSLLKILGLIIFIVGIICLEIFDIFSVAKFSSEYFTYAIQHPWVWIAQLPIVAIPILLQYHYFNKNYYIDTYMQKDTKKRDKLRSFSFLDRYGKIGEIISLELKLITRHKRTKALVWMSFIYVLFGFLFFSEYQPETMKGFGAIFIVGLLAMSYGQWVFSWNSSHFDALLSKNITARELVLANYILMQVFCIIPFILSLFYIFIFNNVFPALLLAFLYCVGFVVPFLLFFATYNHKRIDLNNKSAMNFQGTTMKNFFVVLPVILFPLLIYPLLNVLSSSVSYAWIIGGLGVLGILLTPLFIKLCVKQFNKRKYTMADGFREVE